VKEKAEARGILRKILNKMFCGYSFK